MPPSPNIRTLYERWQMAKNTNEEAIARSMAQVVLDWTLARENASWSDYANAVNDARLGL